jgi:hypothetical protein
MRAARPPSPAGRDRVALVLLLLGRPRKAPQERLEAVPVPVQND